ncbi:MAG TPA: DUF1013 domain-containing protein [Rhodospirillaceae bacterium]|nr:DUF1013 domain-containing protein [Rhodospirillaceae bacterium]
MALPLMPKATAVWLVENTTLTFDQIGNFCGFHKLEIQAIADGDVATGIIGLDPMVNAQLTSEEIKRCEKDSRAQLKMLKSELPKTAVRTKGPRYTPISKRAEKPDSVAYLLKTYPELMDSQIARLLGTTKDTIGKVRDKTHWNSANIKSHNPVLSGLCKQIDLDAALKRAQRRVAREEKKAAAAKKTDKAPKEESTVAPAPEVEAPIVIFNSDEQQPDIDPDDMSRSMG